jgi:RNA polymerase sigma-70 factor (ECF subfamily)
MDDSDLEALLARCGLGDRRAFAALYAAMGAKLFGVALRILGNRAEAEEASQEAFVKIWHSAGRFRADRGSAAGWLVAIARNQAIDTLRARRAPTRDIATMPELPDGAPGPEARAAGADEWRRIAACLGELPDDRSAAVRAAYLEGFSYAELAERFAVPLNTMRTWLRRALITLRECMGR